MHIISRLIIVAFDFTLQRYCAPHKAAILCFWYFRTAFFIAFYQILSIAYL